MSHLKSLTLTVAPHQIERNPKLLRRQRLIERLEEQQKLAADPTFTVLVRRWIKDLDGVKQRFDRQKRVKPWWKADGNGSLVLVLKNGLKTMEIEKGKPGIVVGALGRLEAVLDIPFHPHIGVVAQRGRGVLLHDHPPENTPGRLQICR